jgi:hypothetical protein
MQEDEIEIEETVAAEHVSRIDVHNMLPIHMRARKLVSYEGLEDSRANDSDISFSLAMETEEKEETVARVQRACRNKGTILGKSKSKGLSTSGEKESPLLTRPSTRRDGRINDGNGYDFDIINFSEEASPSRRQDRDLKNLMKIMGTKLLA